jgi:hypothetical protein
LKLIFAILILLTGWTTAVFAKPTSLTAFEAKLDRHVSRFDSSGRTLAACVVDLAYEYQLPMAIEFVDRDAMRPLHVEFRNRSVRQVLEDIIRQVPRYRVTFSEGLVDIFTPESRGDPSSPLNAVIRDFAVTEQETRQADPNSEPALTRKTPLLICSMRSAIPYPCMGSRATVLRMSMSSVPWTRSLDLSAINPLLLTIKRKNSPPPPECQEEQG